MTEYLIFFNQEWVGDHSEEWFNSRGPHVKAVLDEIKGASQFVFGGGLEEDVDQAFSADPTSGELVITDGPYVESKEYLGGVTIVEVPDEATARKWGGRIAEACGWPQEVRRFK